MSVPLVAIGASLGGLHALSIVLGDLPVELPAAVAVVQHRRPDSHARLAALLSGRCAMPVREAEDKEPIRPGHIYLAPADYHLLIEADHFALSTDAPVQAARPSIDVLFESAADSDRETLVAILLTAASEDGAHGMLAASAVGAVTIVQDPDEAESPIAPRAALRRAPIQHVLQLSEIGPQLRATFMKSDAPVPSR